MSAWDALICANKAIITRRLWRGNALCAIHPAAKVRVLSGDFLQNRMCGIDEPPSLQWGLTRALYATILEVYNYVNLRTIMPASLPLIGGEINGGTLPECSNEFIRSNGPCSIIQVSGFYAKVRTKS